MPVVADVHTDLAHGGVEHGPADVARPEVELLPEPFDLGDVVLAVLAEVGAVGVDHGCGVVEEAGLLSLVHRQHHHHAELLGQRREPLHGRAVGHRFGVVVVLGLLHLTEVRPVEQLLEAHDLRTLRGCVAGVLLVQVEHGLLVAGPRGLDDGRTHHTGHGTPSSQQVEGLTVGQVLGAVQGRGLPPTG